MPEPLLERILSRAREDVAERKAETSLASLERGLAPSERSLAASLRRPRLGFILECKRASPSRGLLREAFDPAALARSYAWAADGISVITNAPFFQGDRAFLSAVADAAAAPVLCKDFVVDPYQVTEARQGGADAVLLMLSVLDDVAYRECATRATRWGLDVLTEVHDRAELERAVALDAEIVGINNRDLETLEVDLATTEALAPLVPSDRICVAESGVFTHGDVRRLRGRVDAFLVGTSLVVEDDVDRATRLLVCGRFKVCGLTRAEDARAAWAAGATWGGLIFAPTSPRCVELERARPVRAAAPLSWAGVFVDAEVEHVARLASELDLSAVQLHGDEPRDYVNALRSRLPPGCAVWKACRVRDHVPPLAETGADRLVLDAFAPDQRGGTGTRFDWGLLGGHPEREALVLGGGLTPENAAQADALGVWALDVNSGVESAPGRKDPEKLRAFAAQLRGRGRLEAP